jgi:hypothetical protein
MERTVGEKINDFSFSIEDDKLIAVREKKVKGR